jgi:hypothetical protein
MALCRSALYAMAGRAYIEQRLPEYHRFRAIVMTTVAASSVLRGRLNSVHAEQRVVDSLLGVALDVLEPFASDYLSADDYTRLCGLLEVPVGAASVAALTTLARELALIIEADPLVAARLEKTQNRRM